MYRGENLKITIKGDAEFNLDDLDFGVFLYPDRNPGKRLFRLPVYKDKMSRIGDNIYLLDIDYSETETLHLGLYTIEIVVMEGSSHRSIFVKEGAFPVYDSATKTIDDGV